MDSIKTKLPSIPSIKLPKLKKLREWKAETITSNISQFVNRYVPKVHSQSETQQRRKSHLPGGHHPPPPPPTLAPSQRPVPPYPYTNPNFSQLPVTRPTGISTISGGVIETTTGSKAKDNHGLYALKADRNAAKRGILLSIPLKKHKRTGSSVPAPAMVHEKFKSCEHYDESDDEAGSIHSCEEEVLRIEVDDVEPPAAPPRQRKDVKGKAPVVPVLPNIAKNPSELYRLKSADRPTVLPKQDTVDIFKKEEDVFREFDQIFTHEPPSLDSIPPIPNDGIRPKLKQDSSSFSSSIEESYEEVKRKACRRLSSTIRVQDFSADLPRCRSITSPNHNQSLENVPKAPKTPVSILKKPSPAKKPPVLAKPLPIKTVAGKVEKEKPTLKVSPKPTKRFFVYYNDQDELVFNKNYTDNGKQSAEFQGQPQQHQQQQLHKNFSHYNHVDALFKHYYSTEHDSLRSAISTEGIFI